MNTALTRGEIAASKGTNLKDRLAAVAPKFLALSSQEKTRPKRSGGFNWSNRPRSGHRVDVRGIHGGGVLEHGKRDLGTAS